MHWPTNAGEAPATTRPAGYGVAAAESPRIFVAGDPSASGRAPLAFVAPTFRACPEHGEWVGIFRAAWRGPSLFNVCDVPKLFVAAGFSRAAWTRKNCRPEGRLYENYPRQRAVLQPNWGEPSASVAQATASAGVGLAGSAELRRHLRRAAAGGNSRFPVVIEPLGPC